MIGNETPLSVLCHLLLFVQTTFMSLRQALFFHREKKKAGV